MRMRIPSKLQYKSDIWQSKLMQNHATGLILTLLLPEQTVIASTNSYLQLTSSLGSRI